MVRIYRRVVNDPITDEQETVRVPIILGLKTKMSKFKARDLIDPLGEITLTDFDKFSLQLHLNKLATTRSKDRVLQMRAYLRDIFAEAVDQDFLAKDPARKVKVPTQLRETDTTSLTWD
jgi:hypothetical protein